MLRVVGYDPAWPAVFCEIRDRIWQAISDVAVTIEHIGSTAVPGLSAKPVIDLDVVVPSREDVALVARRLAPLGYRQQGNLGIEDREAFASPSGGPAHHLYVCPRDSRALREHLALRDHLRSHPSDAARYADLKRELAARHAHEMQQYVEGKTEFIRSILGKRMLD